MYSLLGPRELPLGGGAMVARGQAGGGAERKEGGSGRRCLAKWCEFRESSEEEEAQEWLSSSDCGSASSSEMVEEEDVREWLEECVA